MSQKNSYPSPSRARKRKKRTKRRIMMWVLFPILIIGICATVYGATLYKKAESVVNDSYKPVETISKRAEKVDPITDNISILLIGIDESNTRNFGEGARTDALMVATLNPEDKSVKLVSIPRDSYVKIPDRKAKTKINHAHAYGGTALTIETVQELLDIPIDYYMKMNFNAFIDVVDAIDGIKVEVPYEIIEQDSKDRADAIHLEPGLQTLDGEEALAFARTRHQDSDIERGKRQQEVVKAVLKRAMSVNTLPKLPNMIEAVGKNMTTNLTFDEMRSLAAYATAGTNINIETLTLEGSDSMINRVYYYTLDEEALEDTQIQLKYHLGLIDAEDDILDSVNQDNPVAKNSDTNN